MTRVELLDIKSLMSDPEENKFPRPLILPTHLHQVWVSFFDELDMSCTSKDSWIEVESNGMNGQSSTRSLLFKLKIDLVLDPLKRWVAFSLNSFVRPYGFQEGSDKVDRYLASSSFNLNLLVRPFIKYRFGVWQRVSTLATSDQSWTCLVLVDVIL